ncbi:MAG: glycosyltransferase [Marinifilaceae bacterium]|jgi:glycosyltransferase involved in cell wall biosynthesis
MNQPLVSVKTITYNHALYIRECIEGVLMQKTNFPFEFIIGDDCSTDGTTKIVNEYAQKYPGTIRLVSSSENVGAHENDKRTYNACQGKYIALCEGDDYWTDPMKLQKQFDFMETHPDYGMVHTSYSNKVGLLMVRDVLKYKNIPEGEVFQDLILNNFVVTATVFMRRSLLQDIQVNDFIIEKNWAMGDYPMWLELAARSKIGFLSEDMATYRVHSASASHHLDWKGMYSFFENRFDIKKHYAEKYHCLHLLPLLEQMYHKELLKYSIFLKNKKLREKCVRYFNSLKRDKPILWFLFAKHKILDPLFAFLYFLKKKFKLRESL